MIEITIKPGRLWDEKNNEFIVISEPVTLKLEHSLVSLSKWESKWKKPFILSDKRNPHSNDEMYDYIRCMILNETYDANAIYLIDKPSMTLISEYLSDSYTATTFSAKPEKEGACRRREIITSELIYSWMVELEIPWEAQTWNLNRLMTLIRVRSIRSSQQNGANKKSGGKADIARRNASLNAARRKSMHSRG